MQMYIASVSALEHAAVHRNGWIVLLGWVALFSPVLSEFTVSATLASRSVRATYRQDDTELSIVRCSVHCIVVVATFVSHASF